MHLATPRKLAMLVFTSTVLLLAGLSPAYGQSSGNDTSTPGHVSLFHMSFGAVDPKLARRSEQYITNEGYVTSDRTQATVFHITEDRLSANGNLISANPSDPYIVFASNPMTGSITTVWTRAYFPSWSNKAFKNGQATYCQGSDSRVYIVLQSPPSVCTPVVASTLPVPSATSVSSNSVSASTIISSITLSTATANSSSSVSTAAASSSSFVSTAAASSSSSVSTAAANSSSSVSTVAASSTSSVSTAAANSTSSVSTAAANSTSSVSTAAANSTNSVPTTTSAATSSANQVAEATSIIESGRYQSFCSDYLGYTTPVNTVTVTVNATADATTTATSGVITTSANVTTYDTVTVPLTTETNSTTPVTTTTTTTTSIEAFTSTIQPIAKRDTAPSQGCKQCDARKLRRSPTTSSVAIPSPLQTFAPDVLSSACSLEASSVTVTSTVSATATQNQTILFTTTVPSSTQTIVSNVTDTTTVSEGTTTEFVTASTSTSTETDTETSTTTITVASNAPSGTLTYLSVDPDPNAGAGYALSDPATHMTDNFYEPSHREIFIVTPLGELYSVTNDAYYYPDVNSDNKLLWSHDERQASTLFYTKKNSTNNENQLFLYASAKGPTYIFCVATADSGDGNSATGLHIHFYNNPSDFNPGSCALTNLFLVPTS